MDSTIIQINCLAKFLYYFMDRIEAHLKQYTDYKVTSLQNSDIAVDFVTENMNVRLIVTESLHKPDIDVCVLHHAIVFPPSLIDWKIRGSPYKEIHPTAPIIIAAGYNAEDKYKPSLIRKAALDGKKMFNQKMGNELANEVGAIKYIEYSLKTGKGIKILIDEIIYAGLGKLKDEDERKSNTKCCKIT